MLGRWLPALLTATLLAACGDASDPAPDTQTDPGAELASDLEAVVSEEIPRVLARRLGATDVEPAVECEPTSALPAPLDRRLGKVDSKYECPAGVQFKDALGKPQQIALPAFGACRGEDCQWFYESSALPPDRRVPEDRGLTYPSFNVY